MRLLDGIVRCEGCYVRAAREWPAELLFESICTQCDQERRVCDLCSSNDITWQEGNGVAGEIAEGEIQITGFSTGDGHWEAPEGSVSIFRFDDGPVAGRSDNREAPEDAGDDDGLGDSDMR